MTETVRADWYPDPTDPQQLRYWDGTQWTTHVAPAVQQPAGTAPAMAAPVRASTDGADRERRRVPLFGARGVAKDLATENEQLRTALASSGALTLAEVQLQTAAAQHELAALLAQISAAREQHQQDAASAQRELASLQSQILDVRHGIDVQEYGLYDFEHPAESSASLASELELLRARIKEAVRTGQAVNASNTFTFNGSSSKGASMVKGLSKTMLAAYNSEAENAIKTVKAGGLSTAVARLERVVEQVRRNGSVIDLSIQPAYHRMRVKELELAARHADAVKVEREAEREHRAELREAKRVEEELRRAREKLDKEREHHVNALAALAARGDTSGVAELEAKLAQIDQSIADVDYRAANVRAGYVYVISNIGAFGETVVKIGMTRRLDPMDRVRELGDASVPFTFDVHALFFSEDAFGVEAMLHRHFAEQRVNRINTRREFFYATPAQVLEVLQAHKVAIVEYRTDADADEYRASRELARSATHSEA